ncbi:MAG: hypothetical protein QOG13_1751 [Sphingomonadales bacterium]|nr:hypothetical protein [Sphingomonadales bacterium]
MVKRLICWLAAGMLLAWPAAAQMPTPTGWDQPEIANFQSFTRCLANRVPGLVTTYLFGDRTSGEWRRARDRLWHAGGFCVLAQGRWNNDMVRGGFAEALYVQRFPALPVLAPRGEVAPPRLGQFSLPHLAGCIVDRRSAGVDALLRTQWKSAAEQAAVEALLGDIRGCGATDPLPPLITMIRFRMALALALFERTQGIN